VPTLLYRRYIDFEGVSYKPEKFLAQSRYSILAKQLCTLPRDEQNVILQTLTRETLPDKVPLETPELQKAVMFATFRAIVWKNFSLARELAKDYILSRPKQKALLMLIRIVEIFPFTHHLMLRATGSRKEDS